MLFLINIKKKTIRGSFYGVTFNKSDKRDEIIKITIKYHTFIPYNNEKEAQS